MLGGCDIDAVSAATYSHNFGTPFINRDIVELAHNPDKLQDLLQEIGYNKNKPTILIGCAPCQGFTSHRKKYWDEADDIRNNLINIFAKIAQTILPEAIIMENVPELLSNRYWKYFSAAKGTLEKSGYVVKECIYNAASFGVPQDRFRSIVICMKKNFVLPNGYPKYFIMENVSGLGGKRGKTILEELLERLNALGYSVHIRLLDAQEYGVPQRRRRYVIVGERGDMGNYYKYPRPISVRHTVRETIGMLPPPPEDGSDHPDFPLHRRDRLSETNLRRLAALSEGQGRDNLPKELLANCHRVDSTVIGYRNVYGRMSWDDVAPTITAKFDSFTRGKFGHPDQMRSISLREGALLQTFPIDFIFIGNKIDIARQIGNAVPPVMAERIGKSILDCYRKAGD